MKTDTKSCVAPRFRKVSEKKLPKTPCFRKCKKQFFIFFTSVSRNVREHAVSITLNIEN